MLLVVDIGNTNIKFGIFSGDELIREFSVSTDRAKTADEFAVELYTVFKVYGIDGGAVDSSIISSVVPQITGRMKQAVKSVTGARALVVGPGIKTGLNIKIDNPAITGGDIVAASVAAGELYPCPCIILGMGTATTILVLDENKAMLGGALLPGVGLSLNALTSTSALLSDVAIEAPKNVIGKNNDECLRSGVVFGTACLLDGMIEKIEEELGKNCTVVATGGNAPMIVGNCKRSIILREDLLLQGLKILYNRNKNNPRRAVSE